MAEHVYSGEFYDYIDAGSSASAAVVTQLILGEMQVDSLLDVGAGHGAWAAAWLNAGVRDVLAMDGDYVARDRLAIPAENFIPHDLTTPFALGRKFDLVQSLEVAEHLREDHAGRFVDDLVCHGDVVLFSAAVPHQGGEHHVNEQPLDYWRDHFARHGYAAYDWLRPSLRDEQQVKPWYRFNSIIYANPAGAARLSPAILSARVGEGQALSEGGDLAWRTRRALVSLMPRALVKPTAAAKAWIENRKFLLQLIRYIFTGGFMTLVTIALFSGLVLLKLQPNVAYAITWILCVGLGYVLHSRFSFAGHGERGDLRRTGGRFLVVNLIGLAINQSWVSLFLLLGLSALWANVPMATVTPLLTFALHRYWAFR